VEFVDTVVAMKPYWMIRTLSGIGMDIGIFMFMVNMLMTAVEPSPLAEADREKSLATAVAD